MDTNTARWMQLKRLNAGELSKFHALERAAGNPGGLVADKDGAWQGYVAARAWAFLSRLNDQLGPFWNKNKQETERAAEVREFERRVYPLWRGHLDPANTVHKNALEALHAADRAIHAADFTVNREAGGPLAGSATAQVYA